MVLFTGLFSWILGDVKDTSYILPYLDLRKSDQEQLSNYIDKHWSLFSWGPVQASHDYVSNSDYSYAHA